MQFKALFLAGLAAVALAGCANEYAHPTTAATPTTTTTTVTRDYWGNPVAQSTTVRDAYGNPVASSSTAYPGGAPVYPGTAPVYSGSSVPPATVYPAPAMTERDLAIRAAQLPECRATLLHQDRPGGSNYDPARGAPSCIDMLGRR
jgi:hypothetical protein